MAMEEWVYSLLSVALSIGDECSYLVSFAIGYCHCYCCCCSVWKRHALQYIWLSVISLVLLAMQKLGRDTRIGAVGDAKIGKRHAPQYILVLLLYIWQWLSVV
eukprot:614539_1